MLTANLKVIGVNDVRNLRRMLRKLMKHHEVHIHKILVVVSAEDPRVLGGFKSKYNTELYNALIIMKK